MIKNYFRIAIRNLLKYKGYSFINISGLAIGISLCLLILIFVKHELSYDRFHENADRIVRVNLSVPDREIAVTPSMVAPSLEQISPQVESWVRLYEPTRYSPAIINTGREKFQENSFLYADSSFFEVFTFEFLAGNPQTALRNPNSLVLPESTARKLFGTTNVIGETVNAKILSSDLDFEVTGVIRDIPTNSHFSFDYLASLNTMSNWSQLTDTEVRAANFYTYLLLTSSESTSELEDTIDDFIEKNVEAEFVESLPLIPLTDLYLHSNVEIDIAPMGDIRNVYGFAFLAFMVLLIATINYVNLATARASRRGTEVGIRKALGAVRSQLFKQFYGESIILTIIAVIIAVGIVELFKEPFFNLMGKSVDLNLLSDPAVWIILGIVTVFTSAFSGSYPAILLSSYNPVKVLKGFMSPTGKDGTLRKALVVFQFAISTFLILSTAIIFRQTDFILTKNLGFDKEQVVVLPARDNELSRKQDLLKSEIIRQPGVISATYMSNIPGKVFGGYGSVSTPGSESVSTLAGAADANLIETMGIKLLAGEGFPQNPGYTREQGYVYLINETLASAHGWTPDEAIGKPFNVLGNREGEVVGVMANFNVASLREEVDPLALFINENMYNYLLVKIAPNSTRESLAGIEGVWDQVAPHRPFEFEFMDRQLNALYETEVQTRNLLSLFSALAIFIACLGLVGLSSYLVERRAKEIGIRKVLGASVSSIVKLLSTDFLKLVGIGFILGTPIAYFVMRQWLQNFAYQINMGIAVFLIAGILAIIAAMLTVSWQAIRAATKNPVNSLKSE